MIAFSCPGCGKALSVKDEFAGKRATCPLCKKAVLVPVPPSGRTEALVPGPTEPATQALAPAVAASNSPVTTETVDFDFLAPAQAPGELGRLGSYRVLKVLGAGGMGLVLQAEDPLLKRSVALKVMRPEIAAKEINRQRFLREAQATAAVEHPYIIHIHQVGEERGVPFLAMPLLKGEPLDARLRREGRLPLSDAVRIARQVAEGLAAAHEHGLIHRDIKPGNIWLEDRSGFVKVLDFGLARAASDIHLTQTGTVMGTPAYMAPEQARCEVVDGRCDLFSLGTVLYRMLSGELPFKGHDAMSLLMALAADTPAAVSTLNPDVPPLLNALVMRLLAKNPEDRPQTAAEVAKLLADCTEDSKTVALKKPEPVAPTVDRPSAKRRKLLAVAGVLAVVALAGGIAIMMKRGPAPDGKLLDAPVAAAPTLAMVPFDAPQARAHQSAWAKHLGVPVEFTNPRGMRFQLIPPGEFLMGVTDEEVEAWTKLGPNATGGQLAAPAHRVRLTQPFYIAEREVRLPDFMALMKHTPGKIDLPQQTDPNGPVMQHCSWLECIDFCNRLSESEGLASAYKVSDRSVLLVPGANGYRLPTEAEWEFACRAGTATLWYFGMTAQEGAREFAKNVPEAQGRLRSTLNQANSFGLFNMYAGSMESGVGTGMAPATIGNAWSRVSSSIRWGPRWGKGASCAAGPLSRMAEVTFRPSIRRSAPTSHPVGPTMSGRVLAASRCRSRPRHRDKCAPSICVVGSDCPLGI